MFDFQKLDVYQKSKRFYIDTRDILVVTKLDIYIKDQLYRVSFSVPLNLAEGSGKFSKADRKNYYTTARASIYECIAIMDILNDEKKVSELFYKSHLKQTDELSRIMYTMIQNLHT